jgi:hypothetical protein
VQDWSVPAFFGSSRLQSSNAYDTFTLVAETVIPSEAEESRDGIAYRSNAAHSSIISAYRTGMEVAKLVVLAHCTTTSVRPTLLDIPVRPERESGM